MGLQLPFKYSYDLSESAGIWEIGDLMRSKGVDLSVGVESRDGAMADPRKRYVLTVRILFQILVQAATKPDLLLDRDF
jgi:hypothetical protein